MAQQQQKPKPQPKPRREPKHKPEERLVGLVRAVPSGDTIQIIELSDSREQAQQYKEFQLTMIGLKAPSFGRKTVKDGKISQEKDQNWAFESREHLRKLVIGKTIIYRIVSEHETGDRVYGEVWLNDENLRFGIVRDGWADVITRAPRKGNDGTEQDLPEDYLELVQLKEDAEKNGLGLWSKDTKKMRKVNYRDSVRGGKGEDELFTFFEKNRDKPLAGIVEQVRSGSTLRVLLTKSSDNIPLLLSGIRCPTYKFNDDINSEPFSREAKFITEHYLLHRDVTVTIEGFDNFNNYFGSVIDSEGRNICVALLQMGLANFVEWTAPKSANVSKHFKEAEKSAQDGKVRLWSVKKDKDAQKQGPNSSNKPQASKKEVSATRDVVTGKVVEIVNAGTLTIRGEKGKEFKVNFSSIITPKLLNKREEEGFTKARDKMTDANDILKSKEAELEAKWQSAYASEAKELLRNKLIGEDVKCELDYSRAAFTPKGGKEALPARDFWTVTHKGQNIAVDLVSRGFAKVVRHDSDEPRAKNYQDLIIAEKNAQKASKGIHGPKSNPPVVHRTDLTEIRDVVEPEAEKEGDEEGVEGAEKPKKKVSTVVSRAEAFLSALKRAGKLPAVVENVFTGSRFRLWVPSQSVVIFFSLAGINVPKKNRDGETDPEDLKIIEQAFRIAKDRTFQRNVEVSVLGVDKGGNFLGQLYVNKVELGVKLVEEGLARVQTRATDKLANQSDYKKALEKAQKAKIGIWVNYDEEAEKAKIAARQEERKKERDQGQGEVEGEKNSGKLNISVTEILDGSSFWYQVLGQNTDALESMMGMFQKTNWDDLPAYTPKAKEIVAAKFSQDDHWYRAEVTSVNEDGTFGVIYIDYGNAESVAVEKIRKLPSQFDEKSLTRQAKFGRLAFLIPPKVDDEFGRDAIAFFKDLAWGKPKLTATTYKDYNGNISLVVGDPVASITINGALVSAGLARVEKRRNGNKFYTLLKEEEEKARKDHSHIWQYGDIPDSDDEI